MQYNFNFSGHGDNAEYTETTTQHDQTCLYALTYQGGMGKVIVCPLSWYISSIFSLGNDMKGTGNNRNKHLIKEEGKITIEEKEEGKQGTRKLRKRKTRNCTKKDETPM